MASSSADVVAYVQREVEGVLRRQHILHARRRMVVGVSGGADSLCLLDALAAVVPDARRRLFVGHVDHQLRPGSEADAQHVKQVAMTLNIVGRVDAVDVPAIARAERLGIEAAARLGRYRQLRRVADLLDTDLLLTGHTRDDTVETVLLHLLRGTGPSGLAGIAEVEQFSAWSFGEAVCGRAADLRVIRPLLGVKRAETTDYCEARGIRYLTDETNADPRFLRNRVRGHLLPVLRTYNPAIDEAVTRMARTFRDEDAWLDSETTKRWQRIARPVDSGTGLDLTGWERQPLAIRRRLVRKIAEACQYDEIGFDAVERALAVAAADGPPRADLGGGLAVERRGGLLVFARSPRGE